MRAKPRLLLKDMEALAGYDSSDNEENDVFSPVASSSGAKKGNTDVIRGPEAKSSKVLSISFTT